MSLISITNAKAYADYLGWQYGKILPIFGSSVDVAAPVIGTVQKSVLLLQNLITNTVDDYDQEIDLLDAVHTSLGKANAETAAFFAQNAVQGIVTHCSNHGSSVDASITDLSTYLSYYNGGSGGAKFANPVTPQFAWMYLAIIGSNLPVAGVMTPARHPVWDTTVSANGMGSRAVGGSFQAGTAVNSALYSEGASLIEITTDFSGGAAPPAIAVAGTDDTGATSTTWSATFDSNNPLAQVATTLTSGVTAMARQTVNVASMTGIVAGSVLTIDAGTSNQEVVIVEAVETADGYYESNYYAANYFASRYFAERTVSNTVTIAANNAHTVGATVTGNTTYALSPSVTSRRIRSVSGITITGTYAGGAVRVFCSQPRVGI